VPLERHLAEKLHAYTRSYAGGNVSTRVKDLADMILIGEVAKFEAGRLRKMIHEVFEQRGTHPAPSRLSHPPTSWAVPWRRLASEVHLDPVLDAGYARAAALLNPVLDNGGEDDDRWDAAAWAWHQPE